MMIRMIFSAAIGATGTMVLLSLIGIWSFQRPYGIGPILPTLRLILVALLLGAFAGILVWGVL